MANLLLVDDQPANLVALRAILDDLGQSLVQVHSGEQALQRLATDDFAVVLLDVEMPGLDGFETAERIRGQQQHSAHTPIIFLTSHDIDRSQLEHGYSLGAVDFLVKPLVPVALKAKVQGFVELFEEKQQAQQKAEQLRLLIQSTVDYAIFLLDPEGRVVSWNPGAERIKGYRAEEIIGQHFSRFYPQEAIDRGWPQHELAVARQEGRFEDEGWRVRKDGTQFWANVVIMALRDEKGDLRGFSKITRDLTERKRAEETAQRLAQEETARRVAEENAQIIQEQREKLQVTLVSIGDAVISTDAEGRITFLNPVAEVLTGWAQQEAAGKSLPQVFHIVNEQTRRPAENPAVRALREGVVVGLANHTVLIARDGTERLIDDSASPIRDGRGVTIGVVLVFRDVTERRRAKVALQKSDTELRRLLEFHQAVTTNMGEGLYAVDTRGLVTYMNPAAEAMFGWTSDELMGRKMHDMTHHKHPDGSAFPAEECAGLQVLRRGTALRNYDDVFIRKDGSFFPVTYSSSPLKSDGEVAGLVVVFRDVSQQKHAEAMSRLLADVTAAMVGSLHYQSSLREVAALAVPSLGDFCLFDVLTDDNRLERVGWKHVDPVKAGLAERVLSFTPPKDAGDHPVTKALQDGQPEFVPEVTDEWLEGIATSPEHLAFLRELGICSLMTVPMIVGGRRHGTLTFGYSVSGRRHTADELRLAEEVARRTALTVENAKLFSQLRDADRKKDEFLAVLAHELRNPLAPLANALQVMRLTAADDKTEHMREIMERQVKQMARLVDDLLDVSRITSGKIGLRKERLDLADVIFSALETSRPLIEAAKHELTVAPSSIAIHVDGDKTRLAQVVSNLLANSAKYTPEGGHIWLTVERQNDEAVIRVRDNGIGIAADMLPQIFEMFAQAHRNEGHSQGGLGIGLTLVKRLLELHGGRIEARSPGVGKGSEFVVHLPLASEEALATAAQTGAGKAKPLAAGTSPGRRILVVDDNADSATSLGMLPKQQGNEVRTAPDGPNALQVAADFAPDVVLLDIGMPGMDGFEVARRLRQMRQTTNAVLIAQTGWGQEKDRLRSVEAGFDHHLVKPVDPDALSKLLASIR